MNIAVLLLGAGAASRMRGGDKLREEVAGRPLLKLMAERALTAGLGPVAVTLPALDHPRSEALTGLPVQTIAVPDAAEGMAASIRSGIAALPPVAGVMILPADMPDITELDMATLAAPFDGQQILRGASGDTPGHPVLFPADLIPALLRLTGDLGARPVLKAHADRVRLIPLPGAHALTDLDTPEAWDAWRETGTGKASRTTS